ncbi:MAG: hypothetical protein DRP51_01235 [Candidatus Zixiibacteriota bacterium]|nr:MAG: hypothetical protein DRP51_01235 [candidate division Zixibacteria bacterium]
MYRKIKISFLITLFSIFGFCLPSQLKADEAVRFELIVRQRPALVDNYYEIRRDTVDIIVGQSVYSLIVNMSLDIKVEKADSQSVEFTNHLTTIGKTPYNFAERYKVEYNLPARVENIPGKNGSLYQLLISPRKLIEIDPEICPFKTGSDSQFKSSPSANFDFYFLPNSLADFNWNIIKGYLEADFVQFRDALGISLTNKIIYYLSPCPVNGVKWDKRFGYAIDPGRLRIFSLYSHDYISSEAILTNILILLRQWGYAPPFLVDGLAGYFEFSTFEIKKIKKRGEIPPLNKLMTSSGYYSADPQTAEIVAASFIKFLADNFGIGKLKKLYDKSDDLYLQKNMESIFGQPLDSLETAWNHYIDTVSIPRRLFDFYAGRAGALFKSDLQIEYYEEMLKLDSRRRDSIDTRKKLYMIYYQTGRYYEAEEGYRLLTQLDSSLPVYWQIIGNLNLIIGNQEAAWQAFDSVFALDTTYVSAKLLQAEILSLQGDTTGAIELAEKYYSYENSPPAKIEFLLLLGRLYQGKGENFDSTKAHRYFSDALAWCREMIKKVPNDPAYKFRAGLALIGMRDYSEADNFLELAWFTEKRAYFLGHILLERGKVNDMLGNRDEAVMFYQKCLANPSALRHHEYSRQYIDKPFTE